MKIESLDFEFESSELNSDIQNNIESDIILEEISEKNIDKKSMKKTKVEDDIAAFYNFWLFM